MPEDIVVGEEGFTFNDIRSYILKHPLRNSVEPALTSVALLLTSAVTLDSGDHDSTQIEIDIDEPVSNFVGLLQEWKRQKNKEATLQKLCEAFKDRGLLGFATAFEKRFGQHPEYSRNFVEEHLILESGHTFNENGSNTSKHTLEKSPQPTLHSVYESRSVFCNHRISQPAFEDAIIGIDIEIKKIARALADSPSGSNVNRCWSSLADYLHIETLSRNEQNETTPKFSFWKIFLEMWAEKMGSKATCGALIQALRALDKKNLDGEFCSWYGNLSLQRTETETRKQIKDNANDESKDNARLLQTCSNFEKAVIGKDISIHQLCLCLARSTCAELINTCWSDERQELKISVSPQEAKDMQHFVSFDIFLKILTKWVESCGEDATCGNLREVFRKCRLNEFANRLQEDYEQDSNPKIQGILKADTVTCRDLHKNLRLALILFTVEIALVGVSTVAMILLLVQHNSSSKHEIANSTTFTTYHGKSPFSVSLPFSASPPFSALSPHHVSCRVDCENLGKCLSAEWADDVHWRGHLTEQGIRLILSKAGKIRKLTLDYSVCHTDMPSSLDSVQNPFFGQHELEAITFINVPVEFGGLNMSLFASSRIKEINLINSNFSEASIEKLFRYQMHSLTSLAIVSQSMRDSKKIVDNLHLPNLNRLFLNVSDGVQTFNVRGDFCNKVGSIRELDMGSTMIRMTDMLKLVRCKCLQRLQVKIHIPNSLKSVNVSDLFYQKSDSLKAVKLTFVKTISEATDCVKLNAEGISNLNIKIDTTKLCIHYSTRGNLTNK